MEGYVMIKSISFVKMWVRVWNLIVLAVKFVLHYWAVPTVGIAMSALLWLGDVSLAKTVFWGIFAMFTVAGEYILETNDFVKVERFCNIVGKVAGILFLISLTGIIAKYTDLLSGEFWQVFSWPLFSAAIILFILNLFGQLGISMAISERVFYE